MELKVYRIDKTIPMPEYQTSGSIAFDLSSSVDMIVHPGDIACIPTNLIVEVPDGYGLILAPRSSLAKKMGLGFPHSIGLIDQDFRGPKDEIQIQVQNNGMDAIVISRGARLAQAMVIPIVRCNIVEIEEISGPDRGGFGSTGQ
jgi:dUTP pyrophosphatase